MQSSLAIYLGTVLSIYTGFLNKVIKIKRINIFSIGVLVLSLTILIPGLYIHFISFKSLKQQGRLLYEFNNAQYTYTRDELDQISHTFPNLTRTAMPIKAMKARYYYLAGNKRRRTKWLTRVFWTTQNSFRRQSKGYFFPSRKIILTVLIIMRKKHFWSS